MESGDFERSEAPDEAVEISGNAESRRDRLRRLAVEVDSHSSLLTAARRLRRRLPGDEEFGDPLSTAGAEPVEVLGRRVSALQPERRSVVQELGLAGLQVWQSLSEAAGRGHGDQEMAVLFTDLVGFSSWALQAGDGAALELLRLVGVRVETVIVRSEGRIVKRLGDGVMATFLSADAAVGAAVEAQAEVEAIEVGDYRPQMRAGVHWGSPRRLGGDYLGVDVNIAARVCDAAKAGQVLASDAVLARLDGDGVHAAGRARRLKADGAPRELRVQPITRG